MARRGEHGTTHRRKEHRNKSKEHATKARGTSEARPEPRSRDGVKRKRSRSNAEGKKTYLFIYIYKRTSNFQVKLAGAMSAARPLACSNCQHTAGTLHANICHTFRRQNCICIIYIYIYMYNVKRGYSAVISKN